MHSARLLAGLLSVRLFYVKQERTILIMRKLIYKDFIKYVSLNVVGTIGISCYILIDTFFVSKVLGTTGIAALNFSISIYSLILGLGLMLGIGAGTRYSILKAQGNKDSANVVFTASIKLGIIFGLILMLIGIFGSKESAKILGADSVTFPFTNTYMKTILCFAPFIIINNIMVSFVRNDGNPRLSMFAMLGASLSNIILDYIFMFPLKMGMFGAALATSLAPIFSLLILSYHFISKQNHFKFIKTKMHLQSIFYISSLGLSSLINEVASAVVLITFNLIILKLEGNTGVASYGIVANLALIVIGIFNGIAQGIQPLISKSHGMKNVVSQRLTLKLAIVSSLSMAGITYILSFFNATSLIGIFNSEQNQHVYRLTESGIKIYFIGFFFAGINILLSMYFSCINKPKRAFVVSISRGLFLIIPMVFILSLIWKMNGVWLSFVMTELIVTLGILLIMLCKGLLIDNNPNLV